MTKNIAQNQQERSKKIYQKVIELKCVEDEIMQLYNDKFNIDPYDKSEAYFTEQEQIERYAKNMVFWNTLKNEYPHDYSMNVYAMSDTRFKYITNKRQEFRMMMFGKFKNMPSISKKSKTAQTNLKSLVLKFKDNR